MIPYGRQDINQTDIDSVVNVLQSDFLTQGPQVPLFEKTVSNYCNANHGVAVNSATSALHIACLALDLKKGDYLWTSPNSFVASANCGLYCGAKVDFIDIDPKTYNLSVIEEPVANIFDMNKLAKEYNINISSHCTSVDILKQCNAIYGCVYDPHIDMDTDIKVIKKLINKNIWMRSCLELGISHAMMMHLSCVNKPSRPNQCLIDLLEDDLLENSSLQRVNNGFIIQDSPGLGIVVNDEKVSKYHKMYLEKTRETYYS